MVSIVLSAIGNVYEEFKDYSFSQEEIRCAIVQCLIGSRGTATNLAISQMLNVNVRTVQRVRKKFEDVRNVQAVVKKIQQLQ